LEKNRNIYLVSDLHLGAPNHEKSLIREKHFVRWLDEVATDAAALYLVGDVFDFWFEYRHAVPKGYVRLLGKLAEMADRGVQIHIFAGNHDLWYDSYFEQQFQACIHTRPVIHELLGRTFYIAHGDGLGPGDHGYKLLKFILSNPVSRWLFARLHPNFGIGLANLSSGLSRHANEQKPQLKQYLGKDEYLYEHASQLHEVRKDIQYFVFGHRHIAVEDDIAPGAKLIILGDWIDHFTYLAVTPHEVALRTYPLHPLP